MKTINVRLTFIESVLGTASNNKELHAEYIASHAPDAKSKEEEIDAVGVEEFLEKQMTVFSRDKMVILFFGITRLKAFSSQPVQHSGVAREKNFQSNLAN